VLLTTRFLDAPSTVTLKKYEGPKDFHGGGPTGEEEMFAAVPEKQLIYLR